jgi:hypothetical protein
MGVTTKIPRRVDFLSQYEKTAVIGVIGILYTHGK